MIGRILVVLMVVVILSSLFTMPLVASLSSAKSIKNNANYQESLTGKNGISPSKDTPKQGEPSTLYSDWQNIFSNSTSPSSPQKWDFNNTDAWLSSAYADGNKTRLIVGLNDNKLANTLEVAQIAAKYQGKIVDTISFKGFPGATVVELPISCVLSFVGEIDDAKLESYVEPNLKMQAQLVPNDLCGACNGDRRKCKQIGRGT